MSNDERIQDVHEQAAEIVKHLGPGWSYDPQRNRCADGERLSYAVLSGPQFGLLISGPWWKSDRKGSASVQYPRGVKGEHMNWLPYGVSSPTCGWSWGRDPKQVAAHIQRSVLLPMQELWPGVAERVRQAFDYEDALTASKRRAAAVLGMTYEKPAESWQRDRDTFGFSYAEPPTPSVEIKPSSDDWKIEIRLPVDAAEKFVAEFVKAYAEGRYS